MFTPLGSRRQLDTGRFRFLTCTATMSICQRSWEAMVPLQGGALPIHCILASRVPAPRHLYSKQWLLGHQTIDFVSDRDGAVSDMDQAYAKQRFGVVLLHPLL